MEKPCVFPVLAALALCLLPFSSALPNGAPPSACVSMMPMHRGIVPQASRAPYTMKITKPYQAGQPVKVEILGPDYAGVLLQARIPPDTTAIGSWIDPPANTKNLLCSQNERGAITHANTNVKNNATTYTWMPPSSNCPKAVTFKATVAQSHDVYWLDVLSTPLPIDGTTLCKAVASGSSTIKKTTWTSGILLLLAGHLFLFLGCTY
ncbi:putative defense protein 3 [Lissotriton helveticus]